MGHLRSILPGPKMVPMATLVVVLLAIATTCQGAALPGQARPRREAIVGKMDKSFDLLGVHMGLKFKDVAHPLKGGKFHLKVDDLKKIVKQAHSNKVDLDIEFDGGDVVGDGLFKVIVHYSMVHSDGDGEEKGEVMIERKHVGDMWTTIIKTTAGPHPHPIIPASITNMEVQVESDRLTKLHVKYVNPTKQRDIHINVDRVPGKSAKVAIINGERKHDLTFQVGDLNFKKMDGVFSIAVDGTSLGEPIHGKVTGSKNADVNVIQIELEKGNKKFIQIDTKIKKDLPAHSFEARTKYSVLGGKIAGKLLLKLENNVFTLKKTAGETKDSIELVVTVALGESLSIEGKKNEESMWTYTTKRVTKNSNEVFELTLDTEMTLSEKSKVFQFLSEKYLAFHARSNKIHIFVDKKHRNKLAPKFKVEVHLEKDGSKSVDLTADTTVTPYLLSLTSPYLGLDFEITADHHIGKSLVIDANFKGGRGLEWHLEVTRGDNAKNGRDVSILTKTGGEQMWKITWSTEKVNNENEFKFVLHDTLELNPESYLYQYLLFGEYTYKYRNYLPPFNTRIGELEFYVNKKDKNVVLNKFHAKAKVMKDGNKALELLMTTDEHPYKFELFAPDLLENVKHGMTEAKISVEHNHGQSLEMKTNFEKFTGFKIYKTGSGNERKVELNGKELVMGDYTLTDNSFTTKVTIGDDYLEPKITWEGKLPHTKEEAEAFLLKNHILVKVTGSKRNLDLNLNRKMTKPDFNFGTPEHGKISLKAKGHNSRWGDYSLSRDINWDVANKVIEVNWTGLAQFAGGRLATAAPIETAFHFKVLLDQVDLIGKFTKKVNGEEYSIDFPEGSGVMPKITIGQ